MGSLAVGEKVLARARDTVGAIPVRVEDRTMELVCPVRGDESDGAWPLRLGVRVASLHLELLNRVQAGKPIRQALPVAVFKQRPVLRHRRSVDHPIDRRHFVTKGRNTGRRRVDQAIHTTPV